MKNCYAEDVLKTSSSRLEDQQMFAEEKGGLVCKQCNDSTFDIWNWAVKRDVWLSESHLPRAENNIADLKSNCFYDNMELSLNPYILEQDRSKFGKPEIDVSAAYLRAKCENYVSFKPDSNMFAVDAFTQSWNNIKGYAFPQFSLLEEFWPISNGK